MADTIRNENGATLRDLGAELNVGQQVAVNRKGQLQVTMVQDTTVTVGSTPVRAEDSAFGDGNVMMMAGAVNNRSQQTYNSTQGDVTPIAVNDYGSIIVALSPGTQQFADSPIQAEDAAFANGSGVMMAGAQRQDILAASALTDGDVTVVKTNSVGALWTVLGANHTNSGQTSTRLISAATTNATSVSTTATNLYGYEIYNSNAAVRYVKFYNKATAPTVGTDTPVLVVGVPANQRAFLVSAAALQHFALGLNFATTTGIADSDNTAVGANDLAINIWYRN